MLQFHLQLHGPQVFSQFQGGHKEESLLEAEEEGREKAEESHEMKV